MSVRHGHRRTRRSLLLHGPHSLRHVYRMLDSRQSLRSRQRLPTGFEIYFIFLRRVDDFSILVGFETGFVGEEFG